MNKSTSQFLHSSLTILSMLIGSMIPVLAQEGEPTPTLTPKLIDPVPRDSQEAQQAISKHQFGVKIASGEAAILSTVATGTIVGWPESGFVFLFDDHVTVGSNIEAWWSINTLNPDRGWFYGYNLSTQVAHVTGVADICEIADASIYSYSDWSIGPVDEGDFVLFRNLNTGFYAALRVDDIYGSSTLSATLDATWYLQENGSASFGPCSSGKPVVVLVHGFQSSINPLDCDNDNTGQDPVEIAHWGDTITDDGMAYAVNYWGDMPGWLDDDYDVWIAQLQTSLNRGTPPLGFNGACLRNQINHVVEETGQSKVTLFAHSMGGLVSRACLNHADCRGSVNTLVTLGSPHAGLPVGGLGLILGIDCLIMPGVCEMSGAGMSIFNGIHPNKNGIDYYFIGGDGSSGPKHWQQTLWSWLGAGTNDGLVGKYSAVGWVWDEGVFVPNWWDNPSSPAQYWTDEFHSRAYSFDGDDQVRDDYYHYRYENPFQRSNAYKCFTVLLEGNASPATCSPANTFTHAPAQAPTLAQLTSLLEGNITTGQTISSTLQIDTSSESIIYLSWYTDTIGLSLKRPDGLIIDPAYAAANPGEVAYAAGAGGPEFPPFASYTFTDTLPGEWTLVLDGTALGAPDTDFWAFGMFESDRTLTAGIDKTYFDIGAAATLTATLQNDGSGIPGASVTAEIARSDGVTDTVVLTDQGGGDYASSYTIPNAPGYLSIAISAAGNDGGTDFTRQENLLATVAPQNVQFTGTYSDQPDDGNGDGLYEWLHFNAQVSVTDAGGYVVSALLVSGDGQLIGSAAVDASLDTGVYTVTLLFDGDDIRAAELDGPYTITNLQITEITLGVPSQILEDVYVTTAYNWQDFGGALPFHIFLPIVLR